MPLVLSVISIVIIIKSKVVVSNVIISIVVVSFVVSLATELLFKAWIHATLAKR